MKINYEELTPCEVFTEMVSFKYNDDGEETSVEIPEDKLQEWEEEHDESVDRERIDHYIEWQPAYLVEWLHIKAGVSLLILHNGQFETRNADEVRLLQS